MNPKLPLPKRLACEAGGSAFLLAAIVGSGIMAERLCAGNTGLALLVNSLATGFALYALISSLGPLCGAHFNPWVTVFSLFRKEISRTEAAAYVGAQCFGACLGVGVANLMFGVPVFFLSQTHRNGTGLWLSEFVATFGLLSVVALSKKESMQVTACRISAYIASAYWFTSSTSFANPAVTLARSLTDTFSGIRVADVPAFLGAQGLALFLVWRYFTWMLTEKPITESTK